jgi:hypothetical protein
MEGWPIGLQPCHHTVLPHDQRCTWSHNHNHMWLKSTLYAAARSEFVCIATKREKNYVSRRVWFVRQKDETVLENSQVGR